MEGLAHRKQPLPTVRKPNRGNACCRDQPPSSVDYAVLFDGGSAAEHILVECARRSCNAGQNRQCKQGGNDGLHGCYSILERRQ